jgi:hypothetical protein
LILVSKKKISYISGNTIIMKYKNKLTTYDGIKFKSKLEKTCYQLLTEAGLTFSYEPVTYNLHSAFKYEGNCYEKVQRQGKKKFAPARSHIQSIKYTPDFVGDGWIIETKGHETSDFKLRWKMFKKLLLDSGLNYDLYKPTNITEIKESIILIKQKNHETKITKSSGRPQKRVRNSTKRTRTQKSKK